MLQCPGGLLEFWKWWKLWTDGGGWGENLPQSENMSAIRTVWLFIWIAGNGATSPGAARGGRQKRQQLILKDLVITSVFCIFCTEMLQCYFIYQRLQLWSISSVDGDHQHNFGWFGIVGLTKTWNYCLWCCFITDYPLPPPLPLKCTLCSRCLLLSLETVAPHFVQLVASLSTSPASNTSSLPVECFDIAKKSRT